MESVVNENDSFQIRLCKILNQNCLNKNMIVSPLSVYIILTVCANGAKGETLSQMIKTLSPKSKTISQLNKECLKIIQILSVTKSVKVANAVMSKIDIEKTFKDKCKQFQAEIDSLRSVSQVNKWCADKTNNKITEIIDSIDGVDVLLLNAVYFLCNWQKKFNKNYTHEAQFNCSDISTIQYQRMKFEDDKVLYAETIEYQIVQLDYVEKKLNAIIILPRQNNIDDFIQSLTQDKLKQMIKSMRKNMVVLYLPRFELKYQTTLENILSQMGMRDAFEKEKADFGDMVKNNSYSIDRITHKTYIKVDEEGTEAAAVTAVGASCSGLGPSKYYMDVNHPFLFIIRHSSLDEHYLFISKVEKVIN